MKGVSSEERTMNLKKELDGNGIFETTGSWLAKYCHVSVSRFCLMKRFVLLTPHYPIQSKKAFVALS